MPSNQIKLTITTDSSGAVTGVKNVTTAVENMESETSGFASRIKANWLAVSAVIASIAVATNKATGYIQDVTHMAGRYEELGVAVYQVGKTTGYSKEEMDSFEESLKRSGIAEIEARNTLLRMAASNIDLAESSKLARAAQDLAVVGAMNSSEAFENLIYGIQSANVRVLRTIGLNVSFEEGYKKIAQQLHKTTDELTDYEKTQSRVNTVLEGAANFQGLYEQSMTMAEKQTRSLTRYISDYEIAFGIAFQPAYLKMIEAKTEAYKNLKEAFSDPEFQKDIRDLSDVYATMYGWLTKIPGALTDIIPKLREAAELADKYNLSWLLPPKVTRIIPGVKEIIEGPPQPFKGALPSGLMSEEEKKRWIKVFEDAKKGAEQVKGEEEDIAEVSQKVIDLNTKIQDIINKSIMTSTELIQEQADEWEKAGADRLLVEEWMQIETQKLQDETLKKQIDSLSQYKSALMSTYNEAIAKANEYSNIAKQAGSLSTQAREYLEGRQAAKLSPEAAMEAQAEAVKRAYLKGTSLEDFQQAFEKGKAFLDQYTDKAGRAYENQVSQVEDFMNSIANRFEDIQRANEGIAKTYQDKAASLLSLVDQIDARVKELQASLGETKLDLDVSGSLSKIQSLSDKIDSLYDKIKAAPELEIPAKIAASPAVPFTQGIEYMKEQLGSLPTGADFTIDMSSFENFFTMYRALGAMTESYVQTTKTFGSLVTPPPVPGYIPEMQNMIKNLFNVGMVQAFAGIYSQLEGHEKIDAMLQSLTESYLGKITSFQGLTSPVEFKRASFIKVHPGEMLYPANDNRNYSRSINYSQTIHVHGVDDPSLLARRLVKPLKREIKRIDGFS
jgi:hypothetical protein